MTVSSVGFSREPRSSFAIALRSIPVRFGEVPARQMGIDLVALEVDGSWKYRVIEDNARMPVGAMTMSPATNWAK
jgi:hypothetical protein